MDYNSEITNQLNNVADPCGSAVPIGFYRRIKWELYNPTGLQNIEPGNGVEWDTEVIDRNTHIWTASPFGEQSYQYPVPASDGTTITTGIWCSKLNMYFTDQTTLSDYVSSIGATLLSNNDWYGADISKSSLYKTSFELQMYLIENAGGTYTQTGPRINTRSMLNVDNNNNLTVNFNCLEDHRVSYLKYYDTKPCTFVGLQTNSNVSVSVPGIPSVVAPVIAAISSELSCIPITLQFPYSGIYSAIVEAWNTSLKNAKLKWDMLPSLPNYSDWSWGTIYEHLSSQMEELGNGALALAHEGQVVAIKAFKSVITQALSIVGGGWDIITSFLPKITIAGIAIDIADFCENGVNSLVQQLSNFDLSTVIQDIYSAIGSTYEYSMEYVKMVSRDIVDAVTDFYDWCWAQYMMAGVAISKFLADMALKWTAIPITPNPLWLIVKEVEDILSQVEPLSMILSGNFPGFTASSLYALVQTQIKKIVDDAYAEIANLKAQINNLGPIISKAKNDLVQKTMDMKAYLSGMGEKITEGLTEQYQEAIDAAQIAYDSLKNQLSAINTSIQQYKEEASNLYEKGIEEIKNLDIMADINKFLDLVGIGIDDLIVKVDSIETSMYKSYVDASRQIKDTCKFIYSQISTLSLSKVTQWINQLLQIFGLNITFPSISFCIPILKA